jgi:hypothetical protein
MDTAQHKGLVLLVCHAAHCLLQAASILVAILQFKARFGTVFLEVCQLFCIDGTTSLPNRGRKKLKLWFAETPKRDKNFRMFFATLHRNKYFAIF